MGKTVMVSVRMTEEVKKALDKASTAEERPVAQIIERATREWLKANSYLKK